LNDARPFCQFDEDVQMLIRQRNPKLQIDRRLSFVGQQDDGQYNAALSYCMHVTIFIHVPREK
jgi:hypothetical protein